MIKRLDHKDSRIAEEIYAVFQASYAIETELLNVNLFDFPPLKRSISNFIESTSEFYAFHKNETIAAIIELTSNNDVTAINSLVVHPDFFRQGLGKQLMQFVLKTFKSNLFIVETGVDNLPAIALYKKVGFLEKKQWDTSIGIRKIQLVKSS